MTEEEWLACGDDYRMVEYLRGRASERKLRLVGLACCGFPREFCDPRLTALAAVIERFAEGQATYQDVRLARETAVIEPFEGGEFTPYDREVLVLDKFSAKDAHWALDRFLAGFQYTLAAPEQSRWQPRPVWCQLIRDIFGNPFRPVAVEPAWLTSTVTELARGIYAERAFDRLPILADALQDAGCENPDILDHCRGPGPHVRGCWVVDLVLGKQ
jgi:hypothetical protein